MLGSQTAFKTPQSWCESLLAILALVLFAMTSKMAHGQDKDGVHPGDVIVATVELPDLVDSAVQLATPVSLPRPPACLALDAWQIGCCAAQNWLPAEVLRQRGRTLLQLYCEEKDPCERKAANDLNYFLNLQAKHQEDIGAATAMRAYYTRIALQEQLAMTNEFFSLVQLEAAKQDAAQQSGLPAGTDISSFERSRIEIRDKQLQILSKDRQLRCLLAELTHYDYGMEEVCPEILEICPVEIHCPALKQTALRMRRDLQGWTYISCQVNETSAPIFAKMLGTLIGGWGLPMPKVCGIKYLLCPPDYATLARNMQHELQLTVKTHQRWICQAVEEKCENLKLAYRRIDLAKETIASWEARIVQLERLDEMGDGDAAQLAKAREELLHARSAEVDRRLDARIAEIEVAEAVGGLSDRCCSGEPWLLTGAGR